MLDEVRGEGESGIMIGMREEGCPCSLRRDVKGEKWSAICQGVVIRLLLDLTMLLQHG